jgi:predicted nucleic acid-binding protein
MSATTASDPLTGPVYVDASALAKLYFPESDSDRLNRLLAGRRDLVASDLAVTEFVSSLARRQRDGMLSAAVVQRAQRALLDHLDGGVFQRAELTPDCHRVAERLLIQLMQLTLRAADALHLALTAACDCATMLTYDLRLAKAAKAIGLTVYPVLRENSIVMPP